MLGLLSVVRKDNWVCSKVFCFYNQKLVLLGTTCCLDQNINQIIDEFRIINVTVITTDITDD